MTIDIKHLDLFSGIGGFAIAVDEVFPGSEHIFCDNDKFCQAVLKKHWPQSKIYEDIRTLSNSASSGVKEVRQKRKDEIFLLTGGFPCQPFSQAGKRQGTSDDRYLWPEMLRVIKEFKPTWIIGENVAGIGSLFQYESISPMEGKEYSTREEAEADFRGITERTGKNCLYLVVDDLEKIGYDVQTFIIPACAVNAPHRRDRVWFIAHRNDTGSGTSDSETVAHRQKDSEERKHAQCGSDGQGGDAQNAIGKRSGGGMENSGQILGSESAKAKDQRPSWEKNWIEVASELCRVDDGLPVELGGFKLSKAGHRNAQLKAYGNAIVPQVAIEIMRAIKLSTIKPLPIK